MKSGRGVAILLIVGGKLKQPGILHIQLSTYYKLIPRNHVKITDTTF